MQFLRVFIWDVTDDRALAAGEREMATGIFCGHILYTSWQLSNVLVHQQYGEIKRKQKDTNNVLRVVFYVQNNILKCVFSKHYWRPFLHFPSRVLKSDNQIRRVSRGVFKLMIFLQIPTSWADIWPEGKFFSKSLRKPSQELNCDWF